jgi:hypothetical protein
MKFLINSERAIFRSKNKLTNIRLNPNLSRNWRRKRCLILPLENWDCLISNDASPQFDVVTYSYDPELRERELTGLQACSRQNYSLETSFWGQSLFELCKRLDGSYQVYGFLNGDVLTSVADLNRCFEIGDLYRLDIFQPSLSVSSYSSHPHTLNKANLSYEIVPFVEGMMPFMSDRFLKAYVDFGYWNYSGWGVDVFLWPYLLRNLGFERAAIVHASVALHCKPVESVNRTFPNGLSASQELEQLRDVITHLKRGDKEFGRALC